MKIISILKNHTAIKKSASCLYLNCVKQSREGRLYSSILVPDTLDGRFDLIIVHIMLILRRLRDEGKNAEKLSKYLMAEMFSDMDRNLREMGVGDLSVGRQVKKMAAAFYGRAELWEDALDLGEEQLASTLIDTVFRSVAVTNSQEKRLARYIIALDLHLGSLATNKIINNQFTFPPIEYKIEN